MVRTSSITFTNSGGKAPKTAKGSKANYGTESTSVHNTQLRSGELARQNKNKTQSQQRQIYRTLEGTLVNSYIKDNDKMNSVNMDDICNSLVIPDTFDKNTCYAPATEEEKEKENKASILRSAFPVIATSLALAGGILGLTMVMKKSAASLNDPKLLRNERLPNLGMNMNIKQEHEFGTYMALRNPNKKTILAMIGIFIASGLSVIGKNLVDGVQEIWVKKKEADANKKLQENLIDIETRAFAGKLDVIREELVDKANYFKKVLDSMPENSEVFSPLQPSRSANPFLGFGFNLNFKGNPADLPADKHSDNTKQNKTDLKNSSLLLAIATGATLALGVIMGRKIFKNFVAADSEVRKYVNSETKLIEDKIQTLVDKLKDVSNKEETAGDFESLKNLLKVKRADSLETGEVLGKLKFLSKKDISDTTGEIMTDIKSIYGDAPETLGGKVGEIQYYCYLDETRGHVYNWIMNPENPFTGLLVLALGTVNAAGYSIKKAIEGVKEAAVIQESKNTEKELQERLVDTEIRNFKAKKQSAIEPLMNEFNEKLNSGTASKEELKNMADNILLEIKNGPPFVYS